MAIITITHNVPRCTEKESAAFGCECALNQRQCPKASLSEGKCTHRRYQLETIMCESSDWWLEEEYLRIGVRLYSRKNIVRLAINGEEIINILTGKENTNG